MEEFWDILDHNRRFTGRTHKRGDPLPDGVFHLVVRAWIVNSSGEFIIMRRDLRKIDFPGMWEVPSGSAIAGEESLDATIRETKEEAGVLLLPENAELFSTYHRRNAFYDNWLFRQDFSMADVILQEGETIDARAATWNTISLMMERGEFIGRDVFSEFDLLSDTEFLSNRGAK